MRHLKILVLGPQGSGKTTIIRQVAKETVTTEVNGCTVGLDFGVVEKKGSVVHLFGSPGMRHFEIVRKALAPGSDGVVLVVDSTNAKSVAEGEKYLREVFGSQPPPVVVAANKQDVAGALSPRQIRAMLSFPAVVYPTSANRGIGVEHLLGGFVGQLLEMGKGCDITTLLKNA
jgi:small GTP-binding protein